MVFLSACCHHFEVHVILWQNISTCYGRDSSCAGIYCGGKSSDVVSVFLVHSVNQFIVRYCYYRLYFHHPSANQFVSLNVTAVGKHSPNVISYFFLA